MPQIEKTPNLDIAKQNFINKYGNELRRGGVTPSNIVLRNTERPGIYELDMNPDQQTGKVKNPDMAINAKGEIVIPYARLAENPRYGEFLEQARLTESKDENGIYHFKDKSGNAVPAFEGYRLVALNSFAAMLRFGNKEHGDESKAQKEVIRLLDKNGLIPDLTLLVDAGSLTGVSTGFFMNNGNRINLDTTSEDKNSNAGFLENYLHALSKL